MDLDFIRSQNLQALNHKDSSKILALIGALPKFKAEAKFDDVVRIFCDEALQIYDANFHKKSVFPKEFDKFKAQIYDVAKALMPWRKGPFEVFNTFIDSEWQSFIKFNILKPHLNLSGKIVADIGCNNGYYLFKMLEFSPKKLVGFDPSIRTYLQFKFIDKFVQSGISYELLGVEHLPFYEHKFDTIFCLGVIYHRSDPIKMLKELKQSLNKGGEVFLDTMFIKGESEVALVPKNSYSKIPNIYFVPTVSALQNWCERAKFRDFQILDIKETNENEQRKTEWIKGESLGDFLDKNDKNRTIEGYPAPKRIYVRLSI